MHSFAYALQHSVKRSFAFFQETLGPILVAVVMTLILVTSSHVFQSALIEVSHESAYDMNVQYQSVLSSNDLEARTNAIKGLQGIYHAETITFAISSMQEDSYVGVIALQEDSSLWDEFTVQNGRSGIGVNECYIVLDSRDSSLYPLNSMVEIIIPYFDSASSIVPSIDLFINITGQVSTEIDRVSLFSERATGTGLIRLPSPTVIVIISYESTLVPILDYLSENAQSLTPGFQLNTAIWLDANVVAGKILIGESTDYLETVKSRISLVLSSYGSFALGSNLEGRLAELSAYYNSISIKLIASTFPMFFLALVVSSLQGDRVALVRMRESGLLRTKGYSNVFVTKVHVWQSLFIGIIASALGILIGFLFSWLALSINSVDTQTLSFLSPELILLTLAVTIGVSLASARKSSKTLHNLALTEMLSVGSLDKKREGTSRIIAFTCLFFGVLKGGMWLIGFDPLKLLVLSGGLGSPFLQAVFSAWVWLDSVLNIIAPILLLYGIASLAAASDRFLYSASWVSVKMKGTIGVLASRNLYRNSHRNMQLAMLLALTLGYATWTSVNVDVQLNFSRNLSLAGNGSDVSCFLINENNTSFLPELLNLDGVTNITLEEHFTLETVEGIIDLRAISPDSWKSTAYYQDEWFTFSNQSLGFSVLLENNSIILERLVARSLGLSIGDSITLFYERSSWVLSIFGLFGPEPNLVTSSDGTNSEYLAERTWSYVSIEMSDILKGLVVTQSKLLIKLSTHDLTSEIANELELRNFPIYRIRTFEDYTSLETSLSSTFLSLHIVGVVFSTFLAVFGIWALMTSIRYQRREETRAMRKKGMGRSTLSNLLFWEIVPLLPFMLLGILVGFLTAFGITFSFRSAATPLVLSQFSIGLFSLLTIPSVFTAVLVTIRASCYVRKGRLT